MRTAQPRLWHRGITLTGFAKPYGTVPTFTIPTRTVVMDGSNLDCPPHHDRTSTATPGAGRLAQHVPDRRYRFCQGAGQFPRVVHRSVFEMKYKDYYVTLGLSRSATQDDIRRAYRKLARKYHPDLSKLDDAEARFKELGEAYSVLKDTEKRAAYDRMGDQWSNGQDFQPPPQWDEGFEFSGADNQAGEEARFSEFFDALFGAARSGGGHASPGRKRQTASSGHSAGMAQDLEDAYSGGHYSVPGEDHHAKVVIDLEDAYRGAQRSICASRGGGSVHRIPSHPAPRRITTHAP